MITSLVMGGLAVWRLSSLLVDESGPFKIFENLRSAIGIGHDQDGVPVVYPSRFLPELFKCVWCMSVWVGFSWFVLWAILPPNWMNVLTFPLSLSAFAILVDKIARH